MYSIIDFNRKTGDIRFDVNGTEKIINAKIYDDYRRPCNMHYYDSNNKSVVIINEPCLRPIMKDTDGSLYVKATQYQFDKWMSEHYPDSDNSKVYTQLIAN